MSTPGYPPPHQNYYAQQPRQPPQPQSQTAYPQHPSDTPYPYASGPAYPYASASVPSGYPVNPPAGAFPYDPSAQYAQPAYANTIPYDTSAAAPYGYPAPINGNLDIPPGLPSVYSGSYSLPVPPIPAPNSYGQYPQQQQQQQAYLPHHSVSPSLPQTSQQSVTPQNPPLISASSAPHPEAQPDPEIASPAPKAIKIKFKNLSQPTPPPVADMPTRRDSHNSYSAEQYSSTSGRHMRSTRAAATSYKEPGSDESEEVKPRGGRSKSGRSIKPPSRYAEPDEDDFENSMLTSPAVPATTTRSSRAKRRIVDPDEDEEEADDIPEPEDEEFTGSPVAPRLSFPSRPTRSSLAQAQLVTVPADPEPESLEQGLTGRRSTRSNGQRAKSRHSSADGESYHGTDSEPVSDEDEDEDDLDDFRGSRRAGTGRAGRTSRRDSFVVEDDDDYGSPPPRAKKQTRRAPARNAGRVTRNSTRQHDSEDEQPRKRNLRERANVVNYALPPADITAEMAAAGAADLRAVTESGPKRGGGGGRIGGSLTLRGVGMGFKMPGPPGRDVPQAMGDPDSSDSELDVAGPMKAGAGGGGMVPAGGAPTAAKIQGPSDVPNFGRINPKSSTADADPLGVDMNITFDNVGGLDGHINQLKEMVALPLLYPELFQQFGVTPPRGVLFHGPPGTGKTLLARALAASCSNGNTKISFFMRKGADVLSKWVGEAERQLRMLFEEARAAQPSIIFFDEIDGLAPVRSAKQDQIHASLVSTLLALMDGMDGRGQVIVIGATNRPDSVDPALRRPGRFDREFYFPLPNREARKKIIGINTRKWTPGLSDERLDHLAGLTKGYGGADLRALCTEAALNAIQRRYPQIYSSTDRLLLDPESITVGAKDFMMSVKKIIPSSARSTASAASQLPPHLVPILATPLENVKAAVDKALPRHKPKSALEEAEFEDEIGDDLQKHMMVQSLDTMRTYRPRVLIHGPNGMGQGYIGPAVLHHLEGFHVQTLDLGTIVGDSTRTPEATLVQLFVEAKRHQPSVLYIPSLTAFVAGIPDTARTTFKSLLDSIPSADQVLLLAIQDGPLAEVPKDVRKWFGVGKEGKVELVTPSLDEREAYFSELVESFRKPPTAFPDALPRRKRVLEVLPLAPPLPPRQPTEAEIERELQRDKSAQNMMQHSFVTQIPDLMRKYAKASKEVKETALAEYHRLVAAAEADVEQEPVTGDVLPGLELLHPVIGADGQVVSASALLPGPESAPLPNGLDSRPIVQVNGLEACDSAGDSLDPAAAGLLSAPASQPLPVVDDLTSRHGSRQPSIEPTQLTTQPATASAPEQAVSKTIESIWKPNDIDMEDVYRKFFNYKYYTPQMLMDDIQLIKDNADRVGTPAQVSLLSAMVSSLNLWIDDFDKRWDPEFVRLKERMEMFERERKERKEERRRARAAAEASAPAAIAEGNTATEAGANGLASGSGLGEKRPRDEFDPDAPDAKRPRSDAMDLDPASEPSGPAAVSIASHDRTSEAIPTVPPPQAAPPPVYPPFVCPSEGLYQLSAELRHATGKFNVDQLEQLRAGVYDLLWRRRSEWDRTGVIQQAREWVKEFVHEVQEFMEDSD